MGQAFVISAGGGRKTELLVQSCPFIEGLLADRVQWLLWGLVLSLSFSGFVSVTENMWMWSSKFSFSTNTGL